MHTEPIPKRLQKYVISFQYLLNIDKPFKEIQNLCREIIKRVLRTLSFYFLLLKTFLKFTIIAKSLSITNQF